MSQPTGEPVQRELQAPMDGAHSHPTFAELCGSSDDFLQNLDVAAINLICAAGLPGAEVVRVTDHLTWLDDAADKVRLATEQNYDQFLGNPDGFDRSQAKYCVRILVTVLQRQCGVRYNPKWQGIKPDAPIPREFGRSAADLFIPAIIDGVGGTCGSLPVLYVAIGRRLGYPLQLVKAYRHLFVRWDDPHGERWYHPERFNIEATGPGVHFLPDDHYRTWPTELPNADIEAGIFLKSLSPRENSLNSSPRAATASTAIVVFERRSIRLTEPSNSLRTIGSSPSHVPS